MSLESQLITEIQAAADGSGDLDLRVALGAPGSSVLVRGETRATGAAWAALRAIPTIVAGVATALDNYFGAAQIATNGAGVAPTAAWRRGIQAPIAADKNEGANTLRIRFNLTFPNAPHLDVKVVSAAPATPAWQVEYVDRQGGEVTIAIYDIAAAARRSINNLTLTVALIGS